MQDLLKEDEFIKKKIRWNDFTKHYVLMYFILIAMVVLNTFLKFGSGFVITFLIITPFLFLAIIFKRKQQDDTIDVLTIAKIISAVIAFFWFAVYSVFTYMSIMKGQYLRMDAIDLGIKVAKGIGIYLVCIVIASFTLLPLLHVYHKYLPWELPFTLKRIKK